MEKGDWGRRTWESPVWGDKGSMMAMTESCRRATLQDPQGDISGGVLGLMGCRSPRMMMGVPGGGGLSLKDVPQHGVMGVSHGGG